MTNGLLFLLSDMGFGSLTYGSIVLLELPLPSKPALPRVLVLRCGKVSFSPVAYDDVLFFRQQHQPIINAESNTTQAITTATAIATTLPEDIFVFAGFSASDDEAPVGITVTVAVMTLPLTVSRD